MIDPVTQGLLQEIVCRQSRSLLQYVHDAFPWASTGEEAALVGLQRVIAEDQQATRGLVRFMQRAKVDIPFLGSYPSWFTTINFISLDHLLPMLIREQREEIASLAAALPRVASPEAQDQIRRLLDLKRKHLQALESPVDSPALETAAH